MLTGKDDAMHAGRRQHAHNRVGVKPGGIEDLGIFVAVSPFFVGECIDREMQEGGGFEIMPAELTRRWDRALRRV